MKAEDTIKAIDVLRATLGTMVQEPTYHKSEIVGEKEFKMYIQYPILAGEARREAEIKLRELINSL